MAEVRWSRDGEHFVHATMNATRFVRELFAQHGDAVASALLPDAAAAVELSGSWRHLETAAVLGGWAVAGLVLALVVLRRMARRQSGATVEAGRQIATHRIG